MSLYEPPSTPSDGRGWILPLAALDNSDRPIAGGKAVNLAAMLGAGLAVPAGVCLIAQAFETWLNAIPAASALLPKLQQTNVADAAPVLVAAAELREALAATPLPAPIVTTLDHWWTSARPGVNWAVRSSAVAEDLPEASFAGQYDSVLDVSSADGLIQAVRQCWLSLFSERALLYRARNGLAHRPMSMAVIIQEMVAAQAAGVAFTLDPVSGDGSRIVVEAVQGLGEVLVSGRATPTRFVIDKRTLRPMATGAFAQREAVDRRPTDVALANDDLEQLGKLALSVERLFGCPQDIEWALEDGDIWLLQARPVTSRPPPPTPDHTHRDVSPSHRWWRVAGPGVWTRANMCENFPDAITPMSWSIMETILLTSFQRIFLNLGTDLNRQPWLGVIDGYGYMNLASTEELLGGAQLLHRLHVHHLLGGQDASALPRRSARPRHRAKIGFAQVSSALLTGFYFGANLLRFQGPALVKRTRERTDGFARTDFSTLSDEALLDWILGIGPRAFPELDHQISVAQVVGCFSCGLGCSLAALALARVWLEAVAGNPAPRLLQGVDEMASALAGRDLAKLAGWAQAHPPVADILLAAGDFSTATQELRSSDYGREFLVLWNQFLAQHGHHGRGEMDVYTVRWAEAPDYVLGLLRSFLGPEEPGQVREARALNGDRLWDVCRKQLRNPLKRALLGLLVRRGRQGLALRENIKNQAIRVFALIRRALLDAGRRLQARGVLDNPDDVFFLDLPELREELLGKDGREVRALVTARRAEHACYRSLQPPVLVVQSEHAPAAAEGRSFWTSPASNGHLRGLPVSPGVARGQARVILHADRETKLRRGEVLVAPFTDPGWTPYFLNAAAIVVDIGGQLSHGSVIAREYGIPAVVNVGSATQIIQTGQLIEVDGDTGMVRLIEE